MVELCHQWLKIDKEKTSVGGGDPRLSDVRCTLYKQSLPVENLGWPSIVNSRNELSASFVHKVCRTDQQKPTHFEVIHLKL